MPTTNAGILIPSDTNNLSSTSVLKSTVSGYLTPTNADISETVVSPTVNKINDNNDDIEIEIVANIGITDYENFPGSRPQIASDIKNAIDSENMTLTMRGGPGINGRLYNCDLGPGNVQLGNACGLYQDHRVRGSIVFNKNDPALSGSADYLSHFGKSMIPVYDYWDSSNYYDVSGNVIAYNYISDKRLYSDNDHLYMIAFVKNASTEFTSGHIGFFLFNAYDKSFREMGIVAASDTDRNMLYSRSDTTVFTNVAGYDIPFSPNVCRVSNFDNKLVASYLCVEPMQTDVSAMVANLRIFESYNDGITWSEVSTIAKEYFHDVLYDPSAVPAYTIDYFRMRMVSDGSDILIVWADVTATCRQYRQMRWLRSKDGGKNWEYDLGNNLADMFCTSTTEKDTYDPLYTIGMESENDKFDLTINSDGNYIIARQGEGKADELGIPDPGYNTTAGQRYIIFVYSECGDNLMWKRGGMVNIDRDYDLNIEGMENYNPVGGTYVSWERKVVDLSLFTDTIHGWDYVIIKVRSYLYAAGDTNRNDFFVSIVRYKTMDDCEWTAYPDHVDTGIGNNRYSDRIMLMEPPNRNTAILHLANINAYDAFRHIQGVFHRGHIVVNVETRYSAGGNTMYNMIGFFRCWNNVPVNYSNRFTYLPAVGDPVTHYGFVNMINALGAAVVYNLDSSVNELQYAIPPGTAWGFVGYRFDQLFKAANVETPVSEDESVFRFTIKRGSTFDAGLYVTVLGVYGYQYDTVAAAWRSNYCEIALFPGVDGFTFMGLNGLAMVNDLTATSNVFWEYMLVRRRSNVVLFRRRHDIETDSKIVEDWALVYSGVNASVGAPGALGNSYVRFGCINGLGNYVNGYTWVFKDFTTSKNKTDIYPMKTNYKNYWNGYAPVMDYTIDGGILSSQPYWCMSDYRPPASTDAIYNSMQGEFISPNPTWIGNEWYAISDSQYSVNSLMWLTMKEILLAMPMNVTKNCGKINKYAILGDGVNPATYPTQLSPLGMSFDGGDYVNCGDSYRFILNDYITMGAWIYPDSALSTGFIISRQNNGMANGGYGMYWHGALNQLILYGTGINVGSQAVCTEFGKWIHVAIVINASTVKFFKNGIDITNYSANNCGVVNSPAVMDLHVGKHSAAMSDFWSGYIAKPFLFAEPLDRKVIEYMFHETEFGPLIPSDSFVRIYGASAKRDTKWRVDNSKYGAIADNVVNEMPGIYYLSDRDGQSGMTPGGAGYNNGDVEIVLYSENGGHIAADAVAFINCECTDVAIYARDTLPIGGWLAGDLIINGMFHKIDRFDNIGGMRFNAVTNGILVPTTGIPMRPGMMVGSKIVLYNGLFINHYDPMTTPTLNKIQTVIYNDETTIQVDNRTLVMGAGIARLLSPNLLIYFSEQNHRYWRFVFTNNASNGSKIKVGLIIPGLYNQFITNQDTQFNYSVEAREILKSNNMGYVSQYSYKQMRHNFTLSFKSIDTGPSLNNFSLIEQSFKSNTKFGNGIIFVRGFSEEIDYVTSMVHYCSIDGQNLSSSIDVIPYRNFEIKLKEL